MGLRTQRLSHTQIKTQMILPSAKSNRSVAHLSQSSAAFDCKPLGSLTSLHEKIEWFYRKVCAELDSPISNAFIHDVLAK